MGKKVLVLTGSARANGNSEMMAATFAETARAQGHEVTVWRAGIAKLQGCKACNQCFKQGPCVFNDAFNEVAPLLAEAEVLVLATPVYWFNFPSQLKNVIDKIYAFHIAQKPLKIKESVLLACAEDTDTHVFDGMLATYKLIAGYEGWQIAGMVTINGVAAPGDICKTDALEKVKKIAI